MFLLYAEDKLNATKKKKKNQHSSHLSYIHVTFSDVTFNSSSAYNSTHQSVPFTVLNSPFFNFFFALFDTNH